MPRKNKYAEFVAPRLKDIEDWCREGFIEVEICKRLGIGTHAFNTYKKDHEELRTALRVGKEEADYGVENSLFKRSMGYDYTETTKEMDDATSKVVVTKIVEKHHPPEVTACIFWLKNRLPDRWKDSKYINQINEYKDGITINVRKITGNEELNPDNSVKQPDNTDDP